MFRRSESIRVVFDCGDKLVTKQSHKDECDIHNILRQYSRTGIINHINARSGEYIDLPDLGDYQAAMNTLIDAQNSFASLPAAVRDHFNNDPGRFLDAFNDPSQADYLRSVGLLKPAQADGTIPATASAGDPDKLSSGVP